MTELDRTSLRRHPERARPDAVRAILDEALVVHVGVSTPEGPLVLPMAFGRRDDTLYLHGAVANGLLRQPGPVCVTATLLDGLVLARSAFAHSMNYRSAVLFGELRLVEDADEKRRAFDVIVDHTLPGRSLEARPATDAELRATRVLALDLRQTSAKVRDGGPSPDVSSPATWTGVLPLRTAVGRPAPAEAHPPTDAVRAAVLRRLPRLERRAEHGGFTVDPDPARLDLPKVLAWLRDESYWAQALTEARLLDSLVGSYVVGAYADDGAQVAVARVVSDGITLAWLGDVFVDAAWRGRGVGRAIVAFLLEHPRFGAVRKWLLGTADAQAFYRPFGFEPAPAGRYLARPGVAPLFDVLAGPVAAATRGND
ncbi:MAG: GNAT family N-acetyltransferase [Myxococcota bacterium]